MATDITNPRHFLRLWLQKLQAITFVPGERCLCEAMKLDDLADLHWARFSATHAVDDAALSFEFTSYWNASIDPEWAAKILEKAQELIRPGVPPLSRAATFKAIKCRFPYLREPIFGRSISVEPASDDHRWLEARAWGFFQRYGIIYPKAVTVVAASHRRNFDFFMVTHTAQPVAVEVMGGGWPGKYPRKLELADEFSTEGAITIFLGQPPPGVLVAPYPRELWSEHDRPWKVHGPLYDQQPASDSRFALIRRKVYYLSEPELCDPSGRPLIELILEHAAHG